MLREKCSKFERKIFKFKIKILQLHKKIEKNDIPSNAVGLSENRYRFKRNCLEYKETCSSLATSVRKYFKFRRKMSVVLKNEKKN